MEGSLVHAPRCRATTLVAETVAATTSGAAAGVAADATLSAREAMGVSWKLLQRAMRELHQHVGTTTASSAAATSPSPSSHSASVYHDQSLSEEQLKAVRARIAEIKAVDDYDQVGVTWFVASVRRVGSSGECNRSH